MKDDRRFLDDRAEMIKHPGPIFRPIFGPLASGFGPEVGPKGAAGLQTCFWAQKPAQTQAPDVIVLSRKLYYVTESRSSASIRGTWVTEGSLGIEAKSLNPGKSGKSGRKAQARLPSGTVRDKAPIMKTNTEVST